MKKMNVILRVMFFSLLLPVISLSMLNAQDSRQETNIQNLVESQQFVFKAETVSHRLMVEQDI